MRFPELEILRNTKGLRLDDVVEHRFHAEIVRGFESLPGLGIFESLLTARIMPDESSPVIAHRIARKIIAVGSNLSPLFKIANFLAKYIAFFRRFDDPWIPEV